MIRAAPGIAAGALLSGMCGLALAGDLRAHPVLFAALWTLLIAAHAAAVAAILRGGRDRSAGPGAGVVLAVCALLHLPLLFSDPNLSEDIHRTVRDGWVQLNGQNPYARAPGEETDPALRLPDHGRINHPELPTIYPPLAQMVFAAAAWIAPAPLPMKALVSFADLVVAWLLIRWLRSMGRSPAAAVLWAWHPLAVVEGAGSGHVDAVGVCLLLLAVRGMTGDRRISSSLAWTSAVLVKLVPLAAAPAALRRWRVRDAALAGLFAAVVCAPYVRGSEGRLLEGLGAYAARWEFNGSLFPLLRSGLERLDATEGIKQGIGHCLRLLGDPSWLQPAWGWAYPPATARILAGAAVLIASVLFAVRSPTPDAAVRRSLCALWLFAPAVHPWYLLWVVPGLVLAPGAPWLWLTWTCGYAYLAYAGGAPGDVPTAVWLVEYGGMALLWAGGALRRRALF